jgi:hypothetical protein
MAATTTSHRARGSAGPDRVTVMVLSLAAFLVIFAGLAWQMRTAPARAAHRMVLVRRVYETHVVETVVGPTAGGSSVTQSVSSSVPASSPAPATRSS